MTNDEGALRATFSTFKVRCVGCRNQIGLEQARVLDEGSLCCRRCHEAARGNVAGRGELAEILG